MTIAIILVKANINMSQEELDNNSSPVNTLLSCFGTKEKPGKYPIRKKPTTPEELKRRMNTKIRESLKDKNTNLKSFNGLKISVIEVITEKNTEMNTSFGSPKVITNYGSYQAITSEKLLNFDSKLRLELDSDEEYSSWRTIPSLESTDSSKIASLPKIKRVDNAKKVSFTLS
eukprot:CAMPEP_0205811348 /NCGR_PEP_ID=MMETSP0205-20121125/15526_1 /ASSEMBLY_ACC=CAM_ASM_000278 /TAXON_ID=36767 /ORGANISM="Euplotes focardii, Strain TN1" /LENGTH=172 /DNA_ID=CAMNT_0053090385 /DNA_START=54 /DNA_END=572 /DNA_ORIENTATION=-